MREVWRDVKNYEGYYEVSNLGRVRSLAKTIKIKNKYGSRYNRRYNRQLILKTKSNKQGYLSVFLTKKGLYKCFRVNRLVAEVFIDNPESKPQAHHVNGIKADNRADNLQWMTRSENGKNAVINGLIKTGKDSPLFGKKHPLSKAVFQLTLKGKFIRKFDCISDVTRELGIVRSNITAACTGRYKIAGGFRWKYV